MENFKERIETFARDAYKMGQTRFEDYCGLSHGTISAIKAKGPSAEIVTRIAVKCPELNLNWLFRGEGPMIIGENSLRAVAAPNDVHHNQTVIIGNWGDLKDVLRELVKEQSKEN